jgi:hypothetical protein
VCCPKSPPINLYSPKKSREILPRIYPPQMKLGCSPASMAQAPCSRRKNLNLRSSRRLHRSLQVAARPTTRASLLLDLAAEASPVVPVVLVVRVPLAVLVHRVALAVLVPLALLVVLAVPAVLVGLAVPVVLVVLVVPAVRAVQAARVVQAVQVVQAVREARVVPVALAAPLW